MTPIDPAILPVISRLETLWRSPWLVAGLTQQGRPHYQHGECCQDSYRIGGNADATWMIVADGVSTAGASAHGSNMATHYLDLYLRQELAGAKPNCNLLRSGFAYARNQIASHAKEAGRKLGDYATTLLAAVITQSSVTLGRVGDGSVLTLESSSGGDLLSSRIDCPNKRPQDGIVDLTHSLWAMHYRTEHIRDRTLDGITAVVLSSDGAEHYFMKEDPARRIEGVPQRVLSPSVPGPFLRVKLKELSPLYIVDYLDGLLQFTKQDAFDDDITFVIAAIPPEAPPCSPSKA